MKRKIVETVVMSAVAFCASKAVWVAEWHPGWAWAGEAVILLVTGLALSDMHNQ